MYSLEKFPSESEPEGNWAKNSSQPELPGMLNSIPIPEEQTKEEITSITPLEKVNNYTAPDNKIDKAKKDTEQEIKYVDVREKDEKLLRNMIEATNNSLLSYKKIIKLKHLIESGNLGNYAPEEVERVFKRYYAPVKGHPGYRWMKENIRFPSKKSIEGHEHTGTSENLVKEKKLEKIKKDIPMTAYTEWINNN